MIKLLVDEFHIKYSFLMYAHIAYFLVHSLALVSNFGLSVLNRCAISGTNGSSGFASVKRELIESNTFEIVNAGDHYSFKISKQIEPFELMFG